MINKKDQLVNKYSKLGAKKVAQEYREVKAKMDKFVEAIDSTGVITDVKDPDFGKTPAEVLAKSAEFSVRLAAIREVKNALHRAERFKNQVEQRTEDGDLITPADNPDDDKLLNALRGVSKSRDEKIGDALKRAVDEGRLNFNRTENDKTHSARLGDNDDTSYALLQNALDHADYESEILRTGRITLDPIIRQDLLGIVPRVQLGVGGFKYMYQVPITNAAAGVNEGAAVPPQDVTYKEVEVTLKNSGVSMPIVDQITNDERFLVRIATNQLAELLRQRTGQQLMIGDGSGQNLNGFQSHTTSDQFGATDNGISNVSDGDVATARNQGNIPVYRSSSATDLSVIISEVYKASTNIEDKTGQVPDYACMRSGTLASLMTARDGNNNFLFPQNGFTNGVFPMLGIPVVKEMNMAAGRILVGAFRNNCALGVAGGLNAGIGYNNDDWAKFQRTLRVGFRGNLAVYRPLAFIWVTNVIQ